MYKWYSLLFFSVAMTVGLYADSNAKGTSYRYDTDRTMNQKYLELINIMRAQPRKCGKYGYYKATTPLKWSDKIYRASSQHARDMARHNLTYHKGSGKLTDEAGNKYSCQSSPAQRAKFHGYNYKRKFAYAENVGAGFTDPESIVNAWIKNPGHCSNIMNPIYREMAMAKDINPDSKYKAYWALNLGYRL